MTSVSATSGAWRSRFVWLIVGLCVATICSWILNLGRKKPINEIIGSISTIQLTSELTSVKLPVTQILVATGERYQGSWFVTGWADLGIDLKDVIITPKNDGLGGITEFQIPEAKVLGCRLDFEQSMKWDIQRKVWYPNPFDKEPNWMRDDWQKAAQMLIQRSAENPEFKTIAREHARAVVRSLIEQSGAKAVEVSPLPPLP